VYAGEKPSTSAEVIPGKELVLDGMARLDVKSRTTVTVVT
jgi:hypothetical protein